MFLWIASKDMDFTAGSKSFKAILKAIEKCCRKAAEVFATIKGVQVSMPYKTLFFFLQMTLIAKKSVFGSLINKS